MTQPDTHVAHDRPQEPVEGSFIQYLRGDTWQLGRVSRIATQGQSQWAVIKTSYGEEWVRFDKAKVVLR